MIDSVAHLSNYYLDDIKLEYALMYYKVPYDVEKINLSYNELIRPELSLFEIYERLKEINLSNNKIVEINLSPLDFHPNLEKLDLSYNKIKVLDITPLIKARKFCYLRYDEYTLLQASIHFKYYLENEKETFGADCGNGLDELTDTPDRIQWVDNNDPLITDLMLGVGIQIEELENRFKCRRRGIPAILRHYYGYYIKNLNIIMRDNYFFTRKKPDGICHLCGGKITEKYFQCSECAKFYCMTDFLEKEEKLKRGSCYECKSKVFLFPFKCQTCSLDFTNITDFDMIAQQCPLCQGHLGTKHS